MAQQEDRWPLGLQLMNARVGLAEIIMISLLCFLSILCELILLAPSPILPRILIQSSSVVWTGCRRENQKIRWRTCPGWRFTYHYHHSAIVFGADKSRHSSLLQHSVCLLPS
ncbi:uncharacterized protein LOC111452435 isoform X2 [Cucurbita moschata]|uniref:Uncharacterized protein LOC111452435 isoform X2 n=1 Tax=Cucurbita moschata TaxID=3662 RepID=A0A6J1GAL4_CUCMO|nr:uncharacterized protein LOC111452435 isoform X2 [Cucurbita moschata]